MEILKKAQAAAAELTAEDPLLIKEENMELKNVIAKMLSHENIGI